MIPHELSPRVLRFVRLTGVAAERLRDVKRADWAFKLERAARNIQDGELYGVELLIAAVSGRGGIFEIGPEITDPRQVRLLRLIGRLASQLYREERDLIREALIQSVGSQSSL
jgi:hypothetical protein